MTETNTSPLSGVTEGRIVHVRVAGLGHCQPAIVVNAWGGHAQSFSVNLAVFRDGLNDNARDGVIDDLLPISYGPAMVRWATSVPYRAADADPDPRLTETWHWPQDH